MTEIIQATMFLGMLTFMVPLMILMVVIYLFASKKGLIIIAIIGLLYVIGVAVETFNTTSTVSKAVVVNVQPAAPVVGSPEFFIKWAD